MSSPVMSFFLVAEDNSSIAICKTCSARVQRGGKKTSSFNTTDLAAHLKSHHCDKTVLKEFEAAVVAASGVKVKTWMPPFRRRLKTARTFQETVKRLKPFTTGWWNSYDQLFSVVENPDFRKLIAHLEARYTLPRRYHKTYLPCLTCTEISVIVHFS